MAGLDPAIQNPRRCGVWITRTSRVMTNMKMETDMAVRVAINGFGRIGRLVLRSVIETITREYRRERVLIVSHQVIVNCFRYLLERLDEARILAIDRAADVPNCSVTSYVFDPARGRHGKLIGELVNFIAPLTEAHAPVTAEPDMPIAAKS